MSDSVVPTPSKRPMCEHNETKWHDFEIYDGGQTPGESPDFRGRCPGPVIATEPETPSYIPNPSTDGQQKPCDARCGHDNHRIGCLNDPASEATCKWCRVPIKQTLQGGTFWYSNSTGGLSAVCVTMHEPASDPTPELRERILAALYAADYGDLLNWTTDSVAGRKNMVRRLDAVLSTLGEPK